jgi:hypothetical protein
LHFGFDSIGEVTPLGAILFTEEGSVEGFEGTNTLQEGVPTKVTFTSKVMGIGDKFPSGKNEGEGTMTRHSDGTVDASYQGSLITDDNGHQFMWRSHEMSKVVDDGKLEGVEILTGSTKSQKWARLNKLIIVLKTEYWPSFKKFTKTAYEWKSAVL